MDESLPAIRSIDEPGLKATDQLLRTLRAEVAELLQRSQHGFPGAQPVSFTRRHIEELQREDYYVCEKSDGIRYLLYLTEDEKGDETHYLIDRKNDYWWVNEGNLHFPLPTDVQAFHKKTLLDGELVMDDLGNGRHEPTFLVFDCLVLDGQILMSRDLSKRLGYFQDNIYKPYKRLLEEYPSERQFQPFFISMKDMQVAYGIPMLFQQIPTLKHGNDGLIFTCIKSDYRHGTDQHILKWKEADENTVDFQWRLNFPTVEPDEEDLADGWTEPYVDWEAVPQVDLLVHTGQGAYDPYAELHLEEDEWEMLKALGDPLNDRIVECYMDEQKRWRLSRFRDDKSDGNHVSVVASVMESIRDGVTKQDLLASCPSIRDKWKARQAQARGSR